MSREMEIRKGLQTLDAEGMEIVNRMQMRGNMRYQWMQNNESISACDAEQRFTIDGHTDNGDVRRLYLVNQEKSKLVDELAHILGID